MENSQANKNAKAYVLYCFLKEDVVQNNDKYSNVRTVPSLFFKRAVQSRLLDYALRTYFNVDVEDGMPIKTINGGSGCYKNVYISTSICYEAVCISASDCPTGVRIYTPNPYMDKDKAAEEYLSKNELEQYKDNVYGEHTLYYLFCKKQALKDMRRLLMDSEVQIDSSEYDTYSLHSDTYNNFVYLFAAIDNAAYIKTDISILFP